MDKRSRCTLSGPVAGLSSPLALLVTSAALATYFAAGRDELVLLVVPPVLAPALLLVAVVAALLAGLADVDVEIGSDGLRLGGRYVPFASLTDLVVDGDQVRLVRGAGSTHLYLRRCALLRGIAGTFAELARVQRYKSGRAEPDASGSRSAADADAAAAVGVSLREAWDGFRARRAEVEAIAVRWRVDPVAGGGYRTGAIDGDELAQALGAPGLDPKIRLDAARALLRVDPERAVRVAEEASAVTADPVLESQLRSLQQAQS